MRYDAATGLNITERRFYDPRTGDWISQDPLGFAAGDTNLNRFCGNSPANYTDPTGQNWWSATCSFASHFATTVAIGAAVVAGAAVVVVAAPVLAVPVAVVGGCAAAYGGYQMGREAWEAGSGDELDAWGRPTGRRLNGDQCAGRWGDVAGGAALLYVGPKISGAVGEMIRGFCGGTPQPARSYSEPPTAPSATEALSARANEVHSVLHPIAQQMRTTAALATDEGTTIIGGGASDLTPPQRAILGPGEMASALPGEHAEITVLQAASDNGLTPRALGVTRTICPACQAAIEESGGILTSPTTAIWP